MGLVGECKGSGGGKGTHIHIGNKGSGVLRRGNGVETRLEVYVTGRLLAQV